MPESPLDIPRQWVEFTDPTNAAQRFRCDLTWLTSSWTCVYGAGCQGIYEGRPDDGCCTLGAHFTDKDDVANVRRAAEQLGPDEWELHPGSTKVSAWTEQEDGATKTKVVDGACIFLNRPGFPAGEGCSLHQHAIRTGQDAWTLKPEVCWQLPIRRTYRTVTDTDESEYLEITIAEYSRRGWGPGGHDLDWYCSSNSEAHIGTEPVYVSQAPELTELMGAEAYAVLAEHCEALLEVVAQARAAGQTTNAARRKAAGRPGPEGRRLLELFVHPAALAAETLAAQGDSRRVTASNRASTADEAPEATRPAASR